MIWTFLLGGLTWYAFRRAVIGKWPFALLLVALIARGSSGAAIYVNFLPPGTGSTQTGSNPTKSVSDICSWQLLLNPYGSSSSTSTYNLGTLTWNQNNNEFMGSYVVSAGTVGSDASGVSNPNGGTVINFVVHMNSDGNLYMDISGFANVSGRLWADPSSVNTGTGVTLVCFRWTTEHPNPSGPYTEQDALTSSDSYKKVWEGAPEHTTDYAAVIPKVTANGDTSYTPVAFSGYAVSFTAGTIGMQVNFGDDELALMTPSATPATEPTSAPSSQPDDYTGLISQLGQALINEQGLGTGGTDQFGNSQQNDVGVWTSIFPNWTLPTSAPTSNDANNALEDMVNSGNFGTEHSGTSVNGFNAPPGNSLSSTWVNAEAPMAFVTGLGRTSSISGNSYAADIVGVFSELQDACDYFDTWGQDAITAVRWAVNISFVLIVLGSCMMFFFWMLGNSGARVNWTLEKGSSDE